MIDALLAECNSDDWRVSNLIQCDDGTWLCHLRQGWAVTAHGSGATMTAALVSAMSKRDEPKYFRLGAHRDSPAEEAIVAGKLLETLGLAPKREPVRRI